MVLGTEVLVRQFGGAYNTTELTSSDIILYLKIGTRRVVDKTGRQEADWNGHPDKDTADMAASYFAAIPVIHRFSSIDDRDTKAIEYNKVGDILCDSINRGPSESGTANTSIAYVKGSYKSSRLNPGVQPYKSTY
jgi:hypothetical protein